MGSVQQFATDPASLVWVYLARSMFGDARALVRVARRWTRVIRSVEVKRNKHEEVVIKVVVRTTTPAKAKESAKNKSSKKR